VNDCVTFAIEYVGNSCSKGPSIGNGLWGIKYSRDPERSNSWPQYA